MANAAIAYSNLASTATITVSGALSSAPASYLQNPHVGVRCRVNAAAMAILIDFGSSVSISTVALAGLGGITSAATFRVRLSTVDATGVAGNAFDTGSLIGTPYFSSIYGLFVYLRSAAASGRYMLIDISEAAVSYIEAGIVFAGPRSQFEINFQTPWRRTAVNRSVSVEGVGGQDFIDLRQGRWKQQVSIGFASETERNGFLEDIGVTIVNSGHKDMLWIPDPDSTNLSRDCSYGFHEGDFSLTQDLYVIPPVFGVDLSIRQRL